MKNIEFKCKKCKSNKVSEKVNLSFQPSGCGVYGIIKKVL